MIPSAYINNLASIHPDGEYEGHNYLNACEPDYKELIPNPTLRRRMSRIVKMGVACGMDCIGDTPHNEIDAIITATGLGCLADTEKFMNNLLDNGEQLLNPTAFIQSTFNTVGAQIALMCRNQAYNVTYVHRGISFESALLDGLLRLSEGDRNVLVGAFDEITPTAHTIQTRMGLLRNTIAGEGAQFFLLSNEKHEKSIARVAAPATFITQPEDIRSTIDDYLASLGLSLPDIDLLVSEEELFPHIARETFKARCGEYQTATAFALRQAARRIETDKSIGHALIYNHYYGRDHSLILVSQP